MPLSSTPPPIHTRNSAFWLTHALLPLILLVLLSLLIEVFAVDFHLAQWLYQLGGGEWRWRNAWLTSEVLHTGGKHLSLVVAVGCLGCFVASFFAKALRPARRYLGYLLLTAISASLLVSLLKSSLAVSCPWDFAEFGGKLPYASVWQQLWLRNGVGCFPAAHASAGYSWICIYFVGRHLQSPWRWAGLIIPLLVGLAFGAAQEARGAHFISHDLWTLAICWFVALFSYQLFFVRKGAASAAKVI
jgi:membrane-associated PAP2 superfamily phosphatase